jgi:eukaryotic-like serine/threonine-protein kinase
MIDPQTTRFWQVARQSSLMDEAGLTACWESIPPDKRDVAEHLERRMARQAVQTKRLTLWQAQQLLAGRTSGFKIDRYMLLDLIGQGGMGRVYLALDTRLDRRVALKILAPDRVSNPRSVKRFEREAKVGAQLQHENLVRIYDSGQAHGRLYLVMEYIEGRTIGTLISEQGPIPPATAARLVRQTALGLEQMYRKGMIHRDVNPYNIMVTHDGTAKLADLGLAMKLDEENQVTRDGATVGTFDYVSPEQARHSHSIDIRSDIYSLGCTLYHMMSGRVPFPGGSLPEKLFSHQTVEPPSLADIVPEIPGGLVEILWRMMKKKPEERYATPLQLAHALEPYAEYLPQASVIAGPSNQPIPGSGADTERGSFSAGGGTPVSSGGELETDRVEAHPVGERVGYRTVHARAIGGAATKMSAPGVPLTGLDTGMEIPVVEPGPVTPESDPGAEPEWGLLVNTVPSPHEPVFALTTPARKPNRAPFWDSKRRQVLRTGLIVLAAVASVMGIVIGGWRWIGSAEPTKVASIVTKGPEKKPQSVNEQNLQFVVRFKGDETAPVPDHAETLFDAVDRAMGGDGYVELRNHKPLRLKADQSFDFNSGRPFILRAAPDCTPVIEVEMTNRSKPVIRTGSSTHLTLSGISFVAKYSDANKKMSSPFIKTGGGPVHIDRCAFLVVSPEPISDSCAIETDGGSLTIERCWFLDFSNAIRYSAYDRSIATIERSMIVSDPKLNGWGIEVRVMSSPNGSGRRRLKLQQNTIASYGFLDMSSGSIAPIQVEIKRCAVRAEALLAWKPDKPPPNKEVPSTRVQWDGQNNHYEIKGKHWILHSPRGEQTPLFQLEVTDLDSWQKLFTKDFTPIRGKLKFAKDEKPNNDTPVPRDFDIEGGTRGRAGAVSSEIGPGSRQ